MATVEELKNLGNKALTVKDYEGAISYYSQAINLDPNNHIVFSNRSAVYALAQKYELALKDALTTVKLQPEWAKGYSRLGAAYQFLGDYAKAVEAYQKGLFIDPINEQLQKGIEEARKAAMEQEGGCDDNDEDLQSLLGDPTLLQNYLSYITKPGSVGFDPRFKKLSEMMGKNLGTNPDTSPEPPKKEEPQAPKIDENSDSIKANKAKEEGNKAYKEKNFAVALDHYNTAHQLMPNDITYMNNIAATYLEMKEFEKCIEQCEKAIEIGRENKSDYKMIARSLARIGTAYSKMENQDKAIEYYNKSLVEYRDPVIVKKVRAIEEKIKLEKQKAYINVDIAEEEREAGNKCVSVGDFPGAIKHYSEGLLRNPDDYRFYSNRAMCFQKLMEFHLALRDSDACINLNPDFVKGYLRKANALVALRDPFQAQKAFDKALQLDPNCKEATDGINACRELKSKMKPEELRERASKDPEIQAIIKDPSMQMILQEMQNDPNSAMKHMSNKVTADRILKLIDAGFISAN